MEQGAIEVMIPNMVTTIIAFTLLAVCGPHIAAGPDVHFGDDSQMQAPEKAPPDEPREEQHFCCQSVDPKALTGDNCILISSNQIDACIEVLYCKGSWAKHDGKVHCSQ